MEGAIFTARLLQCMSPLLAQSGHPGALNRCLLFPPFQLADGAVSRLKRFAYSSTKAANGGCK